jgi:hypothetical protein
LWRAAIPELPVPVPELLAVHVLEGDLHLVLHQDSWSQASITFSNMESGIILFIVTLSQVSHFESGIGLPNMESSLTLSNIESFITLLKKKTGITLSNMESGITLSNMESSLTLSDMESFRTLSKMQKSITISNTESDITFFTVA